MIIGGLQKLTLLDFPGYVACTVFTEGCNFRCPFCHNALLVVEEKKEFDDKMSEEDFFEFLDKRKGKLDGVCVSGGEPLVQPDIKNFIRKIKDKGFLVKVDTNGSFPERLKELIEDNLVDFVAMDIKSSPDKYSDLCGLSNPPIEKVRQSVALLFEGKVKYEFRTTVVEELHEAGDFEEVGNWIAGAPRYFLQKYEETEEVIGDKSKMHEPSQKKLDEIMKVVRKYVPQAKIRGEE